MSANRGRIQTGVPQWLGAQTIAQGGHSGPETSLTRPSGETFPQIRDRRRLSELVALHLTKTEDHAVWSASVRCLSVHHKLTQALEANLEIQSGVSIELLGAERCRAISDLAKTRSQGIDGLLLKNNILVLVTGSYEETSLLMKSCLLDCDRVIGSEDRFNLIDLEPDLAAAVARFFQSVNQLDDESDRYDDVIECGMEAELSNLFSTMKNLAAQFESAIEAVANHPAMSVVGLKAKLTVFEMCDECRGDGRALLSLQNSMFRDFDRLLQQHVKKPAPPTPQRAHSLV
ncbi:hypothetical protein [uncultured Rhodoblastus sp.]|uniref:hypothetical protein n=1 Tax=uncultured Rhodoblastus sp. TaxID=543037 RepID=UPI0025EDDC9F|nr:hypothetical protein [uncultured Rhodoblastus sp.]